VEPRLLVLTLRQLTDALVVVVPPQIVDLGLGFIGTVKPHKINFQQAFPIRLDARSINNHPMECYCD
jgi:hypothetical protein